MGTGGGTASIAEEADGFGQWLRGRRRALDLTQRALARQAGCSPETIKKIEAGRLRPSGQLAALLVAHLQLPPEAQPAFVQWARRGTRPALAGTGPTPPAPSSPLPGRLPAPATNLIGREHDLAVIADLLRQSGVRLVTLTGPAGIGKTRLAIAAAAAVWPAFPAGVFFVPLAALTDPDLVAPQIAVTLGLRTGRDHAALLLETLAARPVLLVLDNFEQVLPARRLVADLLAAGSGPRLLVTSRAVLHLYGEHQFPVPPLALPEADPPAPPQHLSRVAAVRLFVARARAVQHTFALTHANAAPVAEICRRLDGLPLALELAAAQIARFASPASLLARLDHRLALLTDGPWDQPPRQQTLRGAIAWSDDLLTAAERRLFYQLAVFQGGWTLEAAAAVAGEALSVAPLLASLADQSLLARVPGAEDAPRFAMLETIREYAAERLAARGEEAAARQRHAAYFLALAERAAPELTRSDQAAWLARLEQEHDNLRAALRHLPAAGDAVGAGRLAGALGRFWYRRAYFTEGRRRLDAVLAGPALPPPVRAGALHWAGVLAWSQGDYAAAQARLEESLALRRAAADTDGVTAVLTSLGAVAQSQGDFARAGALFAESLARGRAAGDQPGTALALADLGLVRLNQGAYTEAAALLQESLALRRALGDSQSVAQCLNNLGIVRRCQGAYREAAALHAESLTLFRALRDTWSEALALANLGVVRLEDGSPAAAARLLRESLLLFQAQDVRPGIATCLEGLAWVAAAQGRAAQAIRLAGAAAPLRAAIHAPRPPPDEAVHARYLAVAARRLSAEELAAARAAGATLALSEAVADALEEPC
jgi:predicted ATPase/DNA-binding XRE family transcriptional regulator